MNKVSMLEFMHESQFIPKLQLSSTWIIWKPFHSYFLSGHQFSLNGLKKSIEMSQKEKQLLNFLFIFFLQKALYLNLNYLKKSSKSPLSDLVFLRKVARGHLDRCIAEPAPHGYIYSNSFCSLKGFQNFWKNLFNGPLQLSRSATGWIGYKIGVGSLIAPCAINFLRICLAKWCHFYILFHDGTYNFITPFTGRQFLIQYSNLIVTIEMIKNIPNVI